MVKAVILVGGPGKGTRFRPLSLEVPKPLFPLAGRAMIEHHIKACSELNDMQEVCLFVLSKRFQNTLSYLLIGRFGECQI